MKGDRKSLVAKEREIFLKAMEREDPVERRAFLDGACGENTELRGAVEELLENAQPDSFLQEPGFVNQIRRSAEAERIRADQNAEEAIQQAAVSEAVIEFLSEILAAGHVWRSQFNPTPDLKLVTVLERARQDLDKRFPDQPLVEAPCA